jgi:circadian clock protein KaiB
LRAFCARHLEGRYQLDIVDVLLEPRRAIADGVIVTPTLVKRGPGTKRRVIGDLSEEATVLATLGLEDSR